MLMACLAGCGLKVTNASTSRMVGQVISADGQSALGPVFSLDPDGSASGTFSESRVGLYGSNLDSGAENVFYVDLKYGTTRVVEWNGSRYVDRGFEELTAATMLEAASAMLGSPVTGKAELGD
jgi:hypothetical protein